MYYFANNTEAFKALLEIPIWLMLLLVLLKYIRIFNSGQFTTATLVKFDTRIPAREGFYISLLSSMGNFFGPFLGGAGIRAIYLKQKYKFTYTNFAATLSGLYVIQFLMFSLVGLISLVVIHIVDDRYSWILYLVFISVFVGSLLAAYVKSISGLIDRYASKKGIFNRVLNKANDVIMGWQLIRRDKSLFPRLLKLSFVGLILAFLIQYIQFEAINADVGVFPVSLYVSLGALSLLISITPSSIGVREAIFLFSGAILNLNTDQILQLALIDRGATLFVMASGYVVVKIYNRIWPHEIEPDESAGD